MSDAHPERRGRDAEAGHARGPSDKDEVLNVRAEMEKRRTRSAAAIESVGRILARPHFLFALLAVHLLWLLGNLPIWPGVRPVDPYPFTFAATVASLEAPLLTLLVLMRQHRDARIAELREEVDLQVALHVEREVSALLRLTGEVQGRLGVESAESREELARLARPLSPEHLLQRLREHLDRAEGDRV